MHIPKKYFHDRLILLLLSINAFATLLTIVLILLRLDGGRTDGYIVQYRANLGLSSFKTGDSSTLLAFMAFVLLVFVFHTIMSMKTYHIRRNFSVASHAMALLLIAVALVVSNALLVLR